MVIDTDHLVNQIHAQVEGVAETGFPMDVFPERIQKIIYDLVTYENYNMEYTASIILSAYATAIGNTYHVKIKGNWVSSCALIGRKAGTWQDSAIRFPLSAHPRERPSVARQGT